MTKPDLHRRSFLKATALSAGALALSPFLTACSRLSEPVPEAWGEELEPLAPLDDVDAVLGQHRDARLREIELAASWSPVALRAPRAGRGRPHDVMHVEMMTYNGRFNGPLVRVREGDRARVRFFNFLGEDTNWHPHGMSIDPAVDDPFLRIPDGAAHTYEFPVLSDNVGTHWYHPHPHGRVSRQLFSGLAGALVVHGELDREPEMRAAQEHVLVLKDVSFHDGRPAEHTETDWANGKEGDLLTVSGKLRPLIRARRGTLRLRLVNASTSRYHRLAFEEHPMHLIATSGGFLEHPMPVNELLLAPAETAEVMVQLSGAGHFRLGALPYSKGGHMGGGHDDGGMGGGHDGGGHDGGHDGMGGMGMDGGDHGGDHGGSGAYDLSRFDMDAPGAPAILLDVLSRGRRATPVPHHLGTVPELDPATAAVTRVVELQHDMMTNELRINGRQFDHHRDDFTARRGDLELWDLVNAGHSDHPFHLHAYPFQVLMRDGRHEHMRAWRDTVNLRPGERVRIAVPLRHFHGRTVFHCHITEHEDRGMMAVLNVRE